MTVGQKEGVYRNGHTAAVDDCEVGDIRTEVVANCQMQKQGAWDCVKRAQQKLADFDQVNACGQELDEWRLKEMEYDEMAGRAQCIQDEFRKGRQ